MSDEPTRLAHLRDAPSPEAAFMGGLIRAQGRPRPPAGKMDELAARLGPVLAAEKTTTSSRATPWIGISLIALALASGAVWITRGEEPAVAKAPAVLETAAPTVAAPAASAPATNAPVAATMTVHALPNAAPSAPPRATPTASAQKACDEVDLVERADTRLRAGDAAGALAATREHEQRCASGALIQERERIAIEALSKLGRLDAAEARAHAFETRFPSSPHLRRVRQVVAR